MTPAVELGFIEKLRGELHGRILELEGAVEELSLTRKAYAAIGGSAVTTDPVEMVIMLRAEIEVIEAERARLQLELEDKGESAGGQNSDVDISAEDLAHLKREYESAMADRTSLLTNQAQLMAERNEAQELASEAQRCADTFETEIEKLRTFLTTAVAEKDRLALQLRDGGSGEIDWTNPPGTPCGTAEARSNKGIGANAPYFISPSEQGLRNEFDIGHTWHVYKVHGNLILSDHAPAVIAEDAPGGAADADVELSPEAIAVHGDQMEESAAAFIGARAEVDAILPGETSVKTTIIPGRGPHVGVQVGADGVVASEVNTRKTPVKVTLEQARDYIVDVLGKDVEFPTSALAQWFDISDSQARELCSKLAQQKIIMRPGAVVGRNARWKYNQEIPAAPTEKPRGERLLDVPAPRHAGAPVPGTGVPAGQAETPGKLKRQQKKAARVKTKPVKGVRV